MARKKHKLSKIVENISNRMRFHADILFKSIIMYLEELLTFLGENRSKKQSFFVLCIDAFLLVLFLVDFNSINSITPIRIDYTTGKVYFEKYDVSFGSLYDVSQVKIEIPSNYCFKSDSLFIELDAITDIVEFSSFSIQPDEITQKSIGYRDYSKIDKINKCGLTIFAKFPRFQGTQFIRVTIITVLLSLVIAKLFGILILLLKGLINKVSKWNEMLREKESTLKTINRTKSPQIKSTNPKTNNMKTSKISIGISIVLALLGIICAVFSYTPEKEFCSSYLLSGSVALLQLALTIVIVEVYLKNADKERQEEQKETERKRQIELKRERVKTLYNNLLETSKEFNEHNTKLIQRFGENTFNGIVEGMRNNRDYYSKDINDYIELIRPEYKMLLCEINSTADLFRLASTSGLLNDDINCYRDFFIAIRACNHLNNLDINNTENHRLIFYENACFYIKVIEIIQGLLDQYNQYEKEKK